VGTQGKVASTLALLQREPTKKKLSHHGYMGGKGDLTTDPLIKV